MARATSLAPLLALILVPLLPPPQASAAEYQMETVANYVVDPVAGEIAVSVAVAFTNTLPDPPGKVSAFTHVDLAIHGGATQVAAEDKAGPLQVDVEAQGGGQVASVRTRARVRYNRSVEFTLRYRLADAATPDLHVRPGVVKFPAWGFGTSSAVSVQLPSGFEVRADGDPMLTDVNGSGLRLTSGPIADPASWLSLITAVLPGEYVTRSATVALSSGTVDLQVRAWSDDVGWGDQTLALLVDALPRLEEAIGLPYPRVGPLLVSESAAGEVSGSDLPSSTAEIQVAFDGSPFTLLHQAAHVWVGDQLAAERWIREGLASHFAALVASELEVSPPYDPAQRAVELAGDAVPLVDWPSGTTSGAAGAYAYAASWALVDRLATSVGEAHLRDALARVVAGVSAYDPTEPDAVVTDGRPYPPVDTRRLLDQLAAVSGVDVSKLFAETAFGSDAAAELARRVVARDAYAGLLDDAGDWGAPDPVRVAMSEWRFEDALALIGHAATWLEGRDALIAACGAAGLVPPDRLHNEYVADGGGPGASAELDAEAALVDAFAGMQARASAPRNPLEVVGLLLAADPSALIAEAGDSFERGDLRAAAASLDRVELELNRAPSDGAVRLAGATVVAALLGLGAGVALRRRSGSHYTAAR